jgi:hypothetical protein
MKRLFWDGRKIILGIILVIVFLLLISVFTTKGENIIFFYPESCLGNWQNPEKAAGQKESGQNYNELNSAFFDGGLKEIYCGNFKGEIPEGKINSIKLKFDWLWTDTKIEYIPVETEQETKSFLQEIIPTREVIFIFDESPLKEEPEKEQIPIEESQTEPTSTESNLNLDFLKLFNFAFAQNEETKTSTSAPENISNKINASTEINTPEKVFQIFYTLNGIDWLYLADVDKSNWQDFSINIPVDNWLDIEKVQIKIQSLPILENYPYVYLKSMILEVNYEKREDNIFSADEIEKIYCGDLNNKPIPNEIIKNITLKLSLLENDETKNFFFKNTANLEDSIENNQSFAKSFFTIYYRSEESNWQFLGEINQENWQNPSFQVPISSFSDIFKIKIEPSLALKEVSFANLYKIWLEIEYENCDDEETRQFKEKRAKIIELITKNNDGDDSWLQNPNAELLINKLMQLVDSNLINPELPLGFKGNKIFWTDHSHQIIYVWEIDKDNLFGFAYDNEANKIFEFEEEGRRWQMFFDPMNKKFIFFQKLR